jgi:rhamnose transport system permease protein
VLAIFVLITASIQPRFLDGSNVRFILAETTLYALVAIGETFVVLTRNVDLSVGSVVGLSAYVSANMFQAHHGIPIPVVFLVGLGIGLLCGVTTGIITAVGRVPSLVVTLAMLYIIRGVDTIVVGSGQVVANALPGSFINIFHASVLGVPDLALASVAAVAVAAYYLRSFRSGRDLYAIGSDPAAARLAGIPIARRVFGAFVLSGAIAGLGGVVWATQYNTIDSTAASGLELQVIAAVVVGGVAIFGGSGSVVGAALGALLLQTISSALNVLGVPSLWTEAISGFLLILAITLDRGIQLRLAAALRRRKVHLGA